MQARLHLKDVYAIFRANFGIFIFQFGILCFILGQSLSQYRTSRITIFDFLLIIFTNHYYLIYGFFPVLFILFSRTIKQNTSIQIIRYISRSNLTKALTLQIIRFLIVYLFIQISFVWVAGLTSFSFDLTTTINHEVLKSYQDTFHFQPISILCVIAYLLFGCAVLVTLLSLLNNLFGYTSMIRWAIVLYAFMFIGFKTNLNIAVPFLSVNNYFILHHALFLGWLPFLSILLLGICILILGNYKQNSLHQIKNAFRFTYHIFILGKKEQGLTYLLFILLTIISIIRSWGYSQTFPFFAIIQLFYGTSKLETNFLSWLQLSFISLLPLFVIAQSKRRCRQYAQLPLLIRFGNWANFIRVYTFQYVQFLIIYCMLIWGTGTILLTYSAPQIHVPLQAQFNYFTWTKFSIIWSLLLLLSWVIFNILSQFIGEITAFIIIVLIKYLAYIFHLTFLYANFGILDLLSVTHNPFFYYELFVIFIITITYLIIVWRKSKYVSNH